jgi:GxxExxY protein
VDDVRENILPELTRQIIGSAISVHRELGPGLLEGTYRECFMRQLAFDGMHARREVPVPMRYKASP